MKPLKTYETPETEVIECELQGIVCESPEETQFTGTGLDFTHGEGQW